MNTTSHSYQPARLRVVSSEVAELVGTEFSLADGATASIGRVSGADWVIPDSGVSRVHARLERTATGGVVVRDNNSSNGVYVGAERVLEGLVPPGGRFTVGGTTVEVLIGQEQVAADRTMVLENVADLIAEASDGRADVAARPSAPVVPESVPALESQGESVAVLANDPFVVDDATSLWVVEEGKVEIFTVAIEAGQPVGARTNFLSIGPGQAFSGIETARYGYSWGFLAVGKAGSRLRRYDLGDLERAALLPEHRPTIVKYLEGWIRGLSRRLSADLPEVPVPDITMQAGTEVALEPDKIAMSAGGSVVWLRLPAAFLLFDGMASMSSELEGVLFPLAPSAWLELLSLDSGEDSITLTPRTTEEGIEDARLWAGLDVFHRVFCECVALNLQIAVADEAVRLDRKVEQAVSAREAGIGAIESVLGGTSTWDHSTLANPDMEPVFRACAILGADQDIEVRRPLGDLDELTFDEKIQAIGNASHFRTRRVALTDNWWQMDQGPMLGQREEDGSPVALLSMGPTRYDLFDFTSGTRVRLDEAKANELVPFAYSFYRPFPDGQLGAKQLMLFAVKGLQREFREVAMAGIAVGFLSTVAPSITGMVFDSAIPQAERGLLLQLCLGLFLVALGTAAFKVTQNVAMMRVQSRMDYGAQAAVWDRLLDLPVTFFRKYSAGDLSDRAAAIDKMRSIIAGTGVAAILGTFASFFNAVQMAFYNVTLAAVGVALTLTYVSLTTGCNILKLRSQRQEMHQRGAMSGLVLQLISGVSKLRVSGSEPHAFRVWATEFASLRRTSFRVGRIGNFMPVINSGFPVLSSMAIFYTLVTLQTGALERGENFGLSTGDFLAFSAAYGIFLGAMQSLGDASVNLMNVVPVYERLEPILKEEPEVDGSKQAPMRLRGGIEISHLFFRYSADSPYVLNDVSLKIEPGEFVALVGGSGSGKSTLMKIMLGFEVPEKGGVYYDGQDLSTLDLRLVRQQLGVVLQESRLLPVDIYRNIVGASARTVADAWEAARKAGLAEDIKRMPMGMHTYVSEGGGGFSGGQKQRLMIARALVHNPKILYLDEATSALDNRTQQIVTESMDRLQSTRIVIAHRLSTIRNADRIFYLENGVMAESGSYDELMALDGAFAQLAKRQLA